MADRDDDWQPATSAPGELYTPEGRIRATYAVMRNLRNGHPRAKRYQRSIARTGFVFVAIALALIPLVALIQAL